jgi:predicted Kef-type K+ transport protein
VVVGGLALSTAATLVLVPALASLQRGGGSSGMTPG